MATPKKAAPKKTGQREGGATTGPYPAILGKGAEAKGKAGPGIYEDSPGWQGYGVPKKVKHKPTDRPRTKPRKRVYGDMIS